MRATLPHLLVAAILPILAPAAFASESAGRRPVDDASLKVWLENMVWGHKFTDEEISAATGLDPAEIAAARSRWNLRADNAPPASTDRLLVLPYPGGRHPRIGFLEGAIDPQRETKVSVFTPWHQPQSPRADYVVVDVPEAIWSNLGLTYLAHTHVPTIWTKQDLTLEPLEWETLQDGGFSLSRRLPNGIEFRSEVQPHRDHVRMRITLTNGTAEKLTDLRVQNCVMLKGAEGFTEQHNDNNVNHGPYAARHDPSGTRWIITAWKPEHRTWGNERCPCLHSDPKFDDCPPGESRTIDGWLSFYEGTEIAQELDRIEATNWWREPLNGNDDRFAPVSGTVTVDGRPLTEGAVIFHSHEGQFVGSRLKAGGAYQIDHVPLGEHAVTIIGAVNGKPLGDRYSDLERSALRLDVREGVNEANFDLSSQ